MSVQQQQLLNLINGERASAGVAALRTDGELNTAANNHSIDMIDRDFFDHVNPSGQDPGARLTQSNYGWRGYAENIAYVSDNGNGVADEAEISRLHTNLMNSSGHRDNILRSTVSEIGLGIKVGDGRVYLTEDFGRPNSSESVETDKNVFDGGTTTPPPPTTTPPPTSTAATAGNDNITGTSGNDTIDALAGNDIVNGGAGNDIITGGAGTDDVTGGAGADTFRFLGGAGGNVEPHDHVRDFEFGVDKLDLGGQTIVKYEEQAGVGTYVNYGPTANHWLLLDNKFGLTSTQKAQLTDPTAGGTTTPPPTNPPPPTTPPPTNPPPSNTGTSGNDNLVGTSGADTLDGLAGNDTINGGAGNDIIIGGSGIDDVTGGAGADTFKFVGGASGNTEPHDHVRDFEFGVDRLDLTGQTIVGYQEQQGVGTYVNYGNGDANHWLLLDNKFGLTSTQKAQLTDPSATGGTTPPPTTTPPPSGSGNLPAHNVVLHETFDNGMGQFTNNWGDVNTSTPGQFSITSNAGTWEDGGVMMQSGSGLGYGLYEFEVSFNKDGPGGYALLWPASDGWPGPEIDVVEVLRGGQEYSTVHYDNGGNDAYNSYFPPNVNSTQHHTYAVNWQDGFLDFYLDGNRYANVTEHVPNDAAHGGQNELPSFGVQTWWNVDAQNNSDFVLTGYDFKYSTIA